MQDQTRSPDADGDQGDPSVMDGTAGVQGTPHDMTQAFAPEDFAHDEFPTEAFTPGVTEVVTPGVVTPGPGDVEALLLADGGVPDGGATWLSTPAAAPVPEVPAPVGTPGLADLPTPADVPTAAPVDVRLPPVPAPLPGRNLDIPNEAIPAVPPEEGTDAVGTIPQVSLRKRWAKAQLSNWRLYLVRVLIAGLAVVAAVAIVPGVWFTSWEWGQFTRIAIIFGLLNATVKPLLQFLSLRFIFNTYGIVVIVINTLLLLLLSTVMDDVLKARSAFAALFAGAAVGVFGLLFETLLGTNPPVLDRDYKERNGLR